MISYLKKTLVSLQRSTILLNNSNVPFMGLGYFSGRLVLVIWANFRTSKAFLTFGGGTFSWGGNSKLIQRMSERSILNAWSTVILWWKGIVLPASLVDTLALGALRQGPLLLSDKVENSWYRVERLFPLSTRMQVNFGLEMECEMATITGTAASPIVFDGLELSTKHNSNLKLIFVFTLLI